MSTCHSVFGWLLAAVPSCLKSNQAFRLWFAQTIFPIQSQATVPSFRAKRSAERAGPCSCMHRSVNSSSVIVWSPSMSSLPGEGNAECKSGKGFHCFFTFLYYDDAGLISYVSLCVPTYPYVGFGLAGEAWWGLAPPAKQEKQHHSLFTPS